jgi:hypothetical protein
MVKKAEGRGQKAKGKRQKAKGKGEYKDKIDLQGVSNQ